MPSTSGRRRGRICPPSNAGCWPVKGWAWCRPRGCVSLIPRWPTWPRDGDTLGEIVMRGNSLMKGYFKDPGITADAVRGGWFHSGDLGVMHPDGYLELRDRAQAVPRTSSSSAERPSPPSRSGKPSSPIRRARRGRHRRAGRDVGRATPRRSSWCVPARRSARPNCSSTHAAASPATNARVPWNS